MDEARRVAQTPKEPTLSEIVVHPELFAGALSIVRVAAADIVANLEKPDGDLTMALKRVGKTSFIIHSANVLLQKFVSSGSAKASTDLNDLNVGTVG